MTRGTREHLNTLSSYCTRSLKAPSQHLLKEMKNKKQPPLEPTAVKTMMKEAKEGRENLVSRTVPMKGSGEYPLRPWCVGIRQAGDPYRPSTISSMKHRAPNEGVVREALTM